MSELTGHHSTHQLSIDNSAAVPLCTAGTPAANVVIKHDDGGAGNGNTDVVFIGGSGVTGATNGTPIRPGESFTIDSLAPWTYYLIGRSATVSLVSVQINT